MHDTVRGTEIAGSLRALVGDPDDLDNPVADLVGTRRLVRWFWSSGRRLGFLFDSEEVTFDAAESPVDVAEACIYGVDTGVRSVQAGFDGGKPGVYPVELLVDPVELALHAVEPAVDVAVTCQDQCSERRADTDNGPEFLTHAWTPRSR